MRVQPSTQEVMSSIVKYRFHVDVAGGFRGSFLAIPIQIRIPALLHLHELFRATSWVIEVGPGMECRESKGRRFDAFFCLCWCVC